MLAKIWKKVLLVICILACLFNVTSKLVNRTSLNDNLNSIKDGISLTDIVKGFENESNTVEDTEKNNEDEVASPTVENTVSNVTDDDNQYVVIY